jgi:hypothetical protein
MAERRPGVGEKVNEHVDRVARRALTSATKPHPNDSVAQLENVAVEAWQNLVGPDGFLPVLILIFLAMVAPPLIGDSHLGAAVSVITGASALLLTVYRSTQRPRVRRIFMGYVAIAAIATTVSYALRGSDFLADSHRLLVILWLNLAVLAMAFPLVLIRAFQHRKITVNTVCATLAAYLIIGLLFTTVYRLFGELAPPFFAQIGPGDPPASAGEYTYFSFIVLTTVGFGDFTPGSDPARAFVMVEAVIGQIFLVTMLARVVAMLGAQRPSLRDIEGIIDDVITAEATEPGIESEAADHLGPSDADAGTPTRPEG